MARKQIKTKTIEEIFLDKVKYTKIESYILRMYTWSKSRR
jgi:hypothetical protein